MSQKTTQNDLNKKFSKGTIATHWLTTLLILILFPLGKYMEDLSPPDKMGLMKIHIIVGIVVLILTLVRSYLFFKAPRPDDLKTGSKFNDKLTIWIHNSFYFLLFAIGVSGIAVVVLGGYGEAFQTGNVELIKPHDEILPLKGHNILSTIMMVLLVLHVAGVIKHYVLTKENTLKRIL